MFVNIPYVSNIRRMFDGRCERVYNGRMDDISERPTMKRKIFEQATDDTLPPVPRDEELAWKRDTQEAERRGYIYVDYDHAEDRVMHGWMARLEYQNDDTWSYEYDDTANNDADTWQAADDDKPVCIHWIWPLLLGVLIGLLVIGSVVLWAGVV